ncbi:hypothetical protein G6009_00725 [Dietzia sp. SLG510A3-30A2]|nr:hypothetical protein [Dietzia sp. SLG510A3-30A2]
MSYENGGELDDVGVTGTVTLTPNFGKGPQGVLADDASLYTAHEIKCRVMWGRLHDNDLNNPWQDLIVAVDGKPIVWTAAFSLTYKWRSDVQAQKINLPQVTFDVDAITAGEISLTSLIPSAQIPSNYQPYLVSAQASAQVASDAKTVAELSAQAADQAKADATLAKTAAETAKTDAETAAALATTEADRAVGLATAQDQAVADTVLAGGPTTTALNATYGTVEALQAVDERTAPQKEVFGLPVPKPHRAPTMAITKTVPDGTAIQVMMTDGGLWGYGRDNSLYKQDAATGQWMFRSYHSNGISLRGGMRRCQDNSLLLFDTLYNIRRSTDEGATWTVVHSRRASGLEPLSSQSMVVHPTTGYVYYGEYTTTPESTWPDVVLWRSTDHGATWSQFHVWPRHEVTPGPTSIRHIHSVQCDPLGGGVYIMAGDSSPATGIWKVDGETCVPVLTNADLPGSLLDAPRAIGMMFFPDYIAWGSDSTNQPFLFRIPRTAFGTDPTQLERGPRLSSTTWGVARAAEDGSRWVTFSSDEAFPNYAADRMTHIYAVEDQGATLYEVGVLPAIATTGVSTLQPVDQPEKYGTEFWFSMRSGAAGAYGAWRARLGYGASHIPWPAEPRVPFTQTVNLTQAEVPAAGTLAFGSASIGAFGNNLAIFESTLQQVSGPAGHAVVEVVAAGDVVYTSYNASQRSSTRTVQGGPVAVVNLPTGTQVTLQVRNLHATTPLTAVAAVTFALLR